MLFLCADTLSAVEYVENSVDSSVENRAESRVDRQVDRQQLDRAESKSTVRKKQKGSS